MRKLLGGIMLAVLGLTPYAFAADDPGQAPNDIRSMTVAELEKAGDAKRSLEDYPEAVRYFQEALRRDKKNATIYNKLGLALISCDEINEAKRAFERAVKLRPNYPDALNNLGVAYFKQKSMGSAAKYFRRAIALDEKRAAFHVNLGVTLFNQKKVEPAMEEYTRALELEPEVLRRSSWAGVTARITSPEERGKFFFELAKVQAKRGDVEDCLRCLKISKDNEYRKLADVYKDALFSFLWDDARLHEIVAPPAAK